jgi:hypothetical protein
VAIPVIGAEKERQRPFVAGGLPRLSRNGLGSQKCAFLFCASSVTQQSNGKVFCRIPFYIATMRLLFLSLVIGFNLVNAQDRLPDTPILSPDAEISVLTIGPWQGELYSAFGHSAMRVSDPSLGMDDFYNYGVFDFDQPNFYINFARGHLNYNLGVDPYPLYRDHFIRYNRYIHEQILNLDSAQKQAVFDYLYWNAQPENMYYMYDYFYNNCASKLRDIVKGSFPNDVIFDSTYITTDYTIRELTDIYLKHQPWGDLGIDICLGLPMDKHARPYEYMFLPDYIESSFDHATIQSGGSVRPLVKEKVSVYESRPEIYPKSLVHPWLAFGLLLAVTCLITWLDWRKRKTSKWFDSLLFGVVGSVGLLLLVLWTATDHRAAARNMNLLWAMPLHLVAIPFYWKGALWTKTYFKVMAGVLVMTLLLWPWLPQQLNVFLIPVVIALAIRAGWNGWFR